MKINLAAYFCTLWTWLTGHTSWNHLFDFWRGVVENYTQALALNIRFQVKNLSKRRPTDDDLRVQIRRFEFDQFGEFATWPNEHTADWDDLIADVECIEQNWVIPLFPTNNPHTTK